MFDNVNSTIISNVTQNDPASAFGYNAIVGNTQFQVVAPQAKGSKVQPGFPALPYVGYEWIAYFSQASNPVHNPTFTTSGSNTGQQVTAGSITQQDATGINRYSQGTQLGG